MLTFQIPGTGCVKYAHLFKIAEFAVQTGGRGDRVDEPAIGDRLDHSTAMLSGGQQKRVAVA